MIPGDYFYTRETQPQVMVTIDEFPALCTGMACHYVYADGVPLITGFTRVGTELTITGVDLGVAAPLKIEMAHLDCSNIVVAETFDSITCDLSGELPAGSWFPVVTEDAGKVKVDETVVAEVITMTVTSVDPKLNLNPAGGDLVTIDGTNFPPSLDSRYNLSVTLGTGTRCVVYEITSEQILCETEPFTTTRRRMLVDAFDMAISVTSDEGDAEVVESGFELNTNPITATSVTPESVSPIALRTIEIQLYADYPTTDMTKDDFTVTLVPESLELTYLFVNNAGVRELNVVAVDTAAKTITVKYGGAYSGTYDLVVKSVANGNVDTSTF